VPIQKTKTLDVDVGLVRGARTVTANPLNLGIGRVPIIRTVQFGNHAESNRLRVIDEVMLRHRLIANRESIRAKKEKNR